jgi:hypothetical protein
MATKKKTAITKKQGMSSASPRSYSALYKDDKTRSVQVVSTATRKAGPSEEVRSSAPMVNWRDEYAHVVRDLRKLLLVSAALFGIIIITGFFV